MYKNMSATMFIILVALSGNIMAFSTSDEECPPNKDNCTYQFTVHHKLSMLRKNTGTLVCPKDGKLYECSNITNEVPSDEVLTLDGYQRMVVAINDRVPGPPIIVYEGQTVIVNVTNQLLSNTVTIHWHGLYQRGTPWMDGVGWVTQCPIGSQQTFTYQFKVEQTGSYWYHSHVGAQRTDGLFGAFIIKNKPVRNETPLEEKIMLVGDWQHDSAEEVYVKNKIGAYYVNGKSSHSIPWSGLINGRGRYTNPDTNVTIPTPLTQFNVTQGRNYRFRVINPGTLYALRISVDNHRLSVVATDGHDLEAREVESFIIYPGERYDFILTANQIVGNYWIRAVRFDNSNDSVNAILHYNGAPTNGEPKTTRMDCSKEKPCTVLNCPFVYFPEKDHINCLTLTDLKSSEHNAPAPEMKDGESKEYFLNFAFPGSKDYSPPSINGRRFVFGGSNSLTQYNEVKDVHCDHHNCGTDKLCTCQFNLDLPENKTIQMVWTNLGVGSGAVHPIHMHGHSFYVVKMNFPHQNKTTGKSSRQDLENNTDINCRDQKNYCNNATWSNESWFNGNIPGLNLKNPPRKDTVTVPPGGYVVLRIRSDNPGKWFVHCHIEVHQLGGMAMILSEGNWKKTPPGLPVCQNFYNNVTRDYDYVLNGTCLNQPLGSSNGIKNLAQLNVITYGFMVCFLHLLML